MNGQGDFAEAWKQMLLRVFMFGELKYESIILNMALTAGIYHNFTRGRPRLFLGLWLYYDVYRPLLDLFYNRR